ncbi:UDP-galactose transporter senju-like [Lytechinus variegatus]|uniref:UDP-galactose transporter senju-like n=1 Tax=Lytechinus variegatus TaxID=7654 RepID=UPI001BB1CF9B|nr:UDP-galactose transporter senju-like [Lytechinus variegatus]XP_041469048.1 UDP-galactose transporter senju-like [Lytechinus variegatus]
MLGLSSASNWIVFVCYMVFCVNHSILVTWTQNKKKGYSYNATAAILHIDALKLLVSTVLALHRFSFHGVVKDVLRNTRVLALYFIPAFLYAVFNNLTFLNLTKFDPTSYSILMQIKIVISGVVYQVLFDRKLSGKQWLSLVFLMFGCMMNQLNPAYFASYKPNGTSQLTEDSQSSLLTFNPAIIFILLQLLCSTIAGVYTELLIKHHSKGLDLWIQNIFMYSNSILCGLILYAASGQPYQKLFVLMEGSASAMDRFKVGAVICNMAAMGIVTAIFLKTLNSIVKNFATALEVIMASLLSWIFFGIPVNLFTAIAILVILISIYVYSRNPLAQQPVLVERRKTKVSESDHGNEHVSNGTNTGKLH